VYKIQYFTIYFGALKSVEVNMATSDSKLTFSLYVSLLHSYCTKMAEIQSWPFVIQTWLHREKVDLRQL